MVASGNNSQNLAKQYQQEEQGKRERAENGRQTMGSYGIATME